MSVRAQSATPLSEASAEIIADELTTTANAYLRLCEQLLETEQMSLRLKTQDELDWWRTLRRRDARTMAALSEDLRQGLSDNDARKAAVAAFSLARESTFGFIEVFLDNDARRGRSVATGGSKGGLRRSAEKGARHRVREWTAWAAANVGRDLSHAAISRVVGRRFGVPWETVRKHLPPRKSW
jgi:hypothetical protein